MTNANTSAAPRVTLADLVHALELRAELDKADRERAAREFVADLGAQFAREFRAMDAELRARGTAPRSTLEEYSDRRMAEIARWNGWDR